MQPQIPRLIAFYATSLGMTVLRGWEITYFLSREPFIIEFG